MKIGPQKTKNKPEQKRSSAFGFCSNDVPKSERDYYITIYANPKSRWR